MTKDMWIENCSVREKHQNGSLRTLNRPSSGVDMMNILGAYIEKDAEITHQKTEGSQLRSP